MCEVPAFCNLPGSHHCHTASPSATRLAHPHHSSPVLACSPFPGPSPNYPQALEIFIAGMLHCPQVLWPGLFERHGARLSHEFDLSTLAHISDGYTSGALDMVRRALGAACHAPACISYDGSLVYTTSP